MKQKLKTIAAIIAIACMTACTTPQPKPIVVFESPVLPEKAVPDISPYALAWSFKSDAELIWEFEIIVEECHKFRKEVDKHKQLGNELAEDKWASLIASRILRMKTVMWEIKKRDIAGSDWLERMDEELTNMIAVAKKTLGFEPSWID